MNTEPQPEETNLEELANTPLSELVEPEWLEMPEIEPQDLELPYDYIQDLIDRGIITEDMSIIDIDGRLLESPGNSPSQERAGFWTLIRSFCEHLVFLLFS